MAPTHKGKRKRSEGGDPPDAPDQPAASPKPDSEEGQSPAEPAESPEPSGEREEEQAFLVSLYKFMKDRHTPIERVPHLGFKQINLWKIYKAVEKLGAYELVTGRRLWKNVYDELGGSPGSTSAATCTRRHYERLVLPYVRFLKGEDDKPLPPAKPRKQYKVSKEPKGDEAGDKQRRASRKERGGDQMVPEKPQAEASPGPVGGQGEELSGEGPAHRPQAAPCPAACPAEAYTRLLSSFYCRGTHGIMSPLAKKKLLAQVSKAEALQCRDGACQHGPGGSTDPGPGPLLQGRQSPGLGPARTRGSPAPTRRLGPGAPALQAAPSPGAGAPALEEEDVEEDMEEEEEVEEEDGGPARLRPPGAPVFTGCFHTCRPEVLKPLSRHPRDYLPGFQDSSATAFGFLGKEAEKPAGPPRLTWGGERGRSSAFQQGGSGRSGPYPRPKACWVPPMAQAAPKGPAKPPSFPGGAGLEAGLRGKRSLEEGGLAQGKKLRAVSPFFKDGGDPSQDAGAKQAGPHLLGPPLGPQAPDGYRGTMLRFPLNFASHSDPGKGPAGLPFGPLVIPAIPAHLLATSATAPPGPAGLVPLSPPTLDGGLRHRLYPVSAWHVQPAFATPPLRAFHLNTKL
ncbi:AT-rich interactive domain-containing protein 5A [Tachyglossus aculeatus]|uniref:AT-rich interactive domain-containing protein 5A n=1 Tax=Tachyglossus aculeatus TaxID=9261 RepID=UPI0018F5FD1C|nr:AT-rich interactive domain-containing protein 5A [Tachyglossus aculeatus]